MAKKTRTKNGIESFLSSLIIALSNDYDLSKLDDMEVKAIKEVESSGGSKVLVVSHWDGSGKNWAISNMDNTDKEYKQAVGDMLGATTADEAYWLVIYKVDGTSYDLTGEAIKVAYSLEPRL